MKKMVFFIILIVSCETQKLNIGINNFIMINKGKLDVKKLKEEAEHDIENYSELTGRNSKGKTYYLDGFINSKNEFFAIYGDDFYGYEKIVRKKNSYLVEIYNYYPDGILKYKGLEFPNDFRMGKWVFYNKNGNIKDEIDYDKPYIYAWEDILSYLNKRKIEMNDILYILRKNDNNKRTWVIEWEKLNEKAELIIINGDNGEIISITEKEIDREL